MLWVFSAVYRLLISVASLVAEHGQSFYRKKYELLDFPSGPVIQNPPGRGLSWWLSGKESTCHAGDTGLIPSQDIPHAVKRLSMSATTPKAHSPRA